MKKDLKAVHVLTGTLIAVFLFVSVSCDNGTDPAPVLPSNTIIGSWEMTTIIMHDTPVGELTIPAAQFLAMSATGAAKSVLNFQEGGEASVVTTYEDSSQDTISGTWSSEGVNLTVEGAGIDDTVTFEVDESTLTLTRTMAINFVPDGPKEDIVIDMIYNRIN